VIALGILVGGLAIWGLSNIANETTFEPIRNVEIIEPTQPSEEELRRMEWEKEAEEVRQQHIKVREMEHQVSQLRDTRAQVKAQKESEIKALKENLANELKLLDAEIKAVEIELGVH